MGDIQIALDVYASDIVDRVMHLAPEIPNEERETLESFIADTLMHHGNPMVVETLAWGIAMQYLRQRQRR